jgi:hypothetical protein
MLRILRRFRLCLLALHPAVAGAQTFPALAPLPGTGTLAAPADPTSFSFVVAGDNRPAKSGDPQPATLTAIVQAIQGTKPAFALWSGDTISGKKPGHHKKMKGEYDQFLGIVAGAQASRDPLKAILDDTAKYPNLSVVFASHQHLFYFHDKANPYQTGPFQRTDPAGAKPLYLVSGGAGAPLTKKATPATGGYHNYLLVQVKGAEVTVTVNKLP